MAQVPAAANSPPEEEAVLESTSALPSVGFSPGVFLGTFSFLEEIKDDENKPYAPLSWKVSPGNRRPNRSTGGSCAHHSPTVAAPTGVMQYVSVCI